MEVGEGEGRWEEYQQEESHLVGDDGEVDDENVQGDEGSEVEEGGFENTERGRRSAEAGFIAIGGG